MIEIHKSVAKLYKSIIFDDNHISNADFDNVLNELNIWKQNKIIQIKALFENQDLN